MTDYWSLSPAQPFRSGSRMGLLSRPGVDLRKEEPIFGMFSNHRTFRKGCTQTMAIEIAGTGAYLPKRRVDNHELSKTMDTSDEWIVSHSGIRFRHIAADDESTSDLAAEASRKALEMAGISADELGLIILATSTPDYACIPSTACVVQAKLGATNAAAFDLTAACTGFIYALETARAMIPATGKPALVIGAEIMSRMVDWTDRSTCVLFGDGAGAVVLRPGEGRGIIDSLLFADGNGVDVLYRDGGSRAGQPPLEAPAYYLQMVGRPVFNFAVRTFVDTVNTLTERNGLTPKDLAMIIPHQANMRIIQATTKRLDLPISHFHMIIEEVANTSAASVGLALDDALRRGLVKRGDLVLTVGFGAGLTSGGNLIEL